MEKMSISSVTQNIFRSAPRIVENNQTNPFGVSFKGKILTADVFEAKKADRINFTGIAKIKNKMVTSTIVGSINDFAANISTRLNSIVSMGRRMRNNITEGWNRADAWWEGIRQREVTDLVKSGVAKIRENYRLTNSNHLLTEPVSSLEEMLTANISMIK